MWDKVSVTSCLELDFSHEFEADGLKFVAAATDERLCGTGDTCVGKYCGTGGSFRVFTSGANRKSKSDYTSFRYQGTVKVPFDKTAGNKISGQMLFDEMRFKQGVQSGAVRCYLSHRCRWSTRQYSCRLGRTEGNCQKLSVFIKKSLRSQAATSSPPAGTSFLRDYSFFVNSFDGSSWDAVQSRWEDVSGRSTHPVANLAGGHFVQSPLPNTLNLMENSILHLIMPRHLISPTISP